MSRSPGRGNWAANVSTSARSAAAGSANRRSCSTRRKSTSFGPDSAATDLASCRAGGGGGVTVTESRHGRGSHDAGQVGIPGKRNTPQEEAERRSEQPREVVSASPREQQRSWKVKTAVCGSDQLTPDCGGRTRLEEESKTRQAGC